MKKPSEVRGELHQRYWTLWYPSAALLNLITILETATRSDFSNIKCPVLMIGSAGDRVVSWDKAVEVSKQFSGRKIFILEKESADEDNHVVCNPIVSPSSVSWLEDAVFRFCKSHAKTVMDMA